MADLARRATRWVGTLSHGNVHVKFHDDRLRKILKIFVSHGVPIRNMYAKFHNDRLRNG